jgi:tetratricopeptide (TPR) repeat protein
MLWMWVSLGITFFLARQLIARPAERRAVVAVMIAFAVCLSTVAYYQYYYELPVTQDKWHKDPEAVLQEAGVHAPPGTPARKMFEDRVFSTEPFATFALTNSLAGFLAPWLIAVLGILLTNWRKPEAVRSVRVGGLLALVLILGCLVLTKSRTAWLATLGGVVLLVVYGRRAGWRPDWRLIAGIGAAAVLLPILGIVVGGLDSLVVWESSKSFLYRLQYWRGTAEMIADHPWFGCGPGNFQQFYTLYKAPQASETIAEPHNFLMEVWSTAGTPALAFLLAIFGGVLWQARPAEIGPAHEPDPALRGESPAQDESERGSISSVYVGALAGCLGGYLMCSLLEYAPSSALLLLGLPAALVTLWLFHGWVSHGRLSAAVLATAIVVMLVNLLGAGGIGFAGVAQTLWLLLALLMNHADAARPESRGSDVPVPGSSPGIAAHPWRTSLSTWPAAGLTIAAGILLACFHQTAYSPVTESQTLMFEGNTRRMLGHTLPALAAYRQAAEADPYSPEPWESLYELSHDAWRQTGDSSLELSFRDAVRESLQRNSRSSHAHLLVGHRWLAAYRRFGRREYLESAIGCYGIAVKLYPHYNLGRAQFAWALGLSGDRVAAEREAAEALRLDALNPHSEQKLAAQQVYDATPSVAGQPPPPGDQNAEQTVKRLRNR